MSWGEVQLALGIAAVAILLLTILYMNWQGK